MDTQFDLGELTKLKNTASIFYAKSIQVYESDVKDLLAITDYEVAKSSFNKVIMRNDYKVAGDRLLVCNKAGIEALYGITPQDTLKIIKVTVSKFNISFFFLGDELIRTMKGRVNKYTEILTKVSGFGWVYHQPQNYLPNIFLNQSGGFRSF